jgi:hypothetical protein
MEGDVMNRAQLRALLMLVILMAVMVLLFTCAPVEGGF